MSKSGFFWNDKKSRFSLITEQRFRSTSSRPIVTEEISKSWMELSSLNEEKFIVLLQETNNFDETTNFLMHNYWNKIENFVKLMRKVSMRWKNWREFKSYELMYFQEEDLSKIETLSSNSQVRFRNYRMKLIVWMIREIFKMLNQYAVDNPTFPVNQLFSHLSRSWRNAKPVSGNFEPQQWAAKYLGHAWFFEKSFCKSTASSSAPLSARDQIFGSLMYQNTHHHMWWVKTKHQFRIRDASEDRQPEIQSSQVREDFRRIVGRPTTTADFRFSFLTNSPRQQHSLVGRYDSRLRCAPVHNFQRKLCCGPKKWRWLNQWMISNLRVLSKEFECQILKYSMRRLLQHWTESTIMPPRASRKRGPFPSCQTTSGGILWKLNKRIAFSDEDRSLTLIYEHFRGTGANGFCRGLCGPIYSCSSKVTIFRNSTQSGTEFYDQWRKKPSDNILEGLYKLRIRECEKLKTVLELYKPGHSPEESLKTWLSQIEDNGEK